MAEQVIDGATPEPVETAEATTAEEQQPVPETQAETGEQPTEEQPAPKPKSGIEKRFSELTARAKAAEMYAQRLEQLMERLPQPTAQPEPPPQGKPTREQFDYDEDRYLEALTDWKLQERLTRAQEEQIKQQRQSEAQRRQMDYAERVQKANATGLSKFEDYEDVVIANPELKVTPYMADALTQTDVAAEIAYHLGKNQQEAQRIASLPPQVQFMEIARLEQKIKAPLPKPTTKAPPPVVPVGGHELATKDPDKMTTAEWMRWREAELKAKKG